MPNKSAIISVLIFAPLSVNAATPYTINPLPVPVGSSAASASSISPNGLVVGSAFIGNWNTLTGYNQPIIWQNGTMSLLPVPQGMSGDVTAINDNGDVIGGIRPGAFPSTGTPGVWRNGQFQPLPITAGFFGGPSAINAAGDIVGGELSIATSDSGVHTGFAVIWSNGQATQIGEITNEQPNGAAINSSGQILLTSSGSNQVGTFISTNGNLVQIPAITGNTIAGQAINDLGQVVGSALAADGEFHAFLYQNGITQDLGLGMGELSTSALAINNSGQIVGVGYKSGGEEDGLFWENGQLHYLNDQLPPNSGWSALIPSGIANDGTIVGTGTYNGQNTPFILFPSTSPGSNPVPEPTTASLLLAAAATIVNSSAWRYCHH